MTRPDIIPIGDQPPLGVVPQRMYASVIRPERYGEPINAFAIEEMPVPEVKRDQVLVNVMAAGINYNNVWVSLGYPLDVIAARKKLGSTEDFHIGGSDGSGVVWAVGENVKELRVGDHVIITSCHWDESAPDIRMGVDPIASTSQRVWGYEDNFGSFAQFTAVEEYMCHIKPPQLTWEAASCFMVSGATAYRQLRGWPPNIVRPGDLVLIWGGAGGLGSLAIQITKEFGGVPIAVVSSQDKADYCMSLGAHGVIDRTEFDHWGRLPDIDDAAGMRAWTEGARAFGKRFWEVLGERRAPRIVFEHVGQQTIPTSMYLVDTGGMVVICGGTSGYNADVDLRFLWMRQKRLQGSHFANRRECAEVNELVRQGRIDPCLSYTAPSMDECGKMHQLMRNNEHPPGNMAMIVNAPSLGMTDLPL